MSVKSEKAETVEMTRSLKVRSRPPKNVRDALKIVNDFNRNGIGMKNIHDPVSGNWYPERELFVVKAFQIVNKYYRSRR